MTSDAGSELSMNYKQWAEVYDLFYEVGPEREERFYLDLMQRCEPPVLELGVGTGRIAIPAAKLGHRIVGLDLHRAMLDVARHKMKTLDVSVDELELIQGDMTDFDLGGRSFGLVVIPGNSLALVLTEEGQSATIAHAARHLKPNGVLAFSLYNASDQVIESDNNEQFLLGVVDDEATGNRHIMSGINRFDLANQLNHCTQFLETVSLTGETIARHELPVTTRYLTIDQAHDLVNNAGLIVEAVYGDFDGAPYTDSSDEMILVCRSP